MSARLSLRCATRWPAAWLSPRSALPATAIEGPALTATSIVVWCSVRAATPTAVLPSLRCTTRVGAWRRTRREPWPCIAKPVTRVRGTRVLPWARSMPRDAASSKTSSLRWRYKSGRVRRATCVVAVGKRRICAVVLVVTSTPRRQRLCTSVLAMVAPRLRAVFLVRCTSPEKVVRSMTNAPHGCSRRHASNTIVKVASTWLTYTTRVEGWLSILPMRSSCTSRLVNTAPSKGAPGSLSSTLQGGG